MTYLALLDQYLTACRTVGIETDLFSEFKFEALRDFSLFGSEADTLSWYQSQVALTEMQSKTISLHECRGWSFEPESGSFVHESGKFFRVEGKRVEGTSSREVTTGWDQPVLTQVGFDGGILGLIRKRFDGIPHYLVEAKAEPGNYNIVQISTTVQATYSNIEQAHRGKKPSYSGIFLTPDEYPVSVLLDQWTSEDGGRLFNKRNRSMLVEYDENCDLELHSERFHWMSLFQIKSMIRHQDAIIAPHIRGIISAL
jgi:oxidase EvaA